MKKSLRAIKHGHDYIAIRMRREVNNWPGSIRWWLRFISCSLFTLFAYLTFSTLEPVKAKQVARLIEIWPDAWGLLVILAFMGSVGLFCSIVAASLFRTLLIPTKLNISLKSVAGAATEEAIEWLKFVAVVLLVVIVAAAVIVAARVWWNV